MGLRRKLLLLVLDGVPLRNWERLFGNLAGWRASGEARAWSQRSVLPSTSASCYASIHTGVSPQVHGVSGNQRIFRLEQPDIFSAVAAAGGTSGAVAHSFWSSFFQRHPFDPVRDLEYHEADGPIHHGRFHTMSGYNLINPCTPADPDLFATLTLLCERHRIDYGLLHSCTLDCMGHRFGHDCAEMDQACFTLDAQLAHWIPRWRALGYELIITADHGQSERGHHGGNEDQQRDCGLYYFGEGVPASPADSPERGALIDQLRLAPTVLTLLGVRPPPSMLAAPFLR